MAQVLEDAAFSDYNLMDYYILTFPDDGIIDGWAIPRKDYAIVGINENQTNMEAFLTLAHELIHVLQFSLNQAGGHGPDFMAHCRRLCEIFDLN